MKLVLYISVLFVASIFFSCEKEVDLNLDTSEPRLVIDASLGRMHPCIVQLTMTQAYWSQGAPTVVSGATITISDGENNSEVLQELDNEGRYVSRMKGITGKVYTLTVEVDGAEYTASDSIPHAVPIKSIRTYKLDSGADQYYFPCVAFDDPKGIANYYYFMLDINSRRMQGTMIVEDKHFDGIKDKEQIVFFDDEENSDEELKVGDEISVEMQSIGKGAYNFYNTLIPPAGGPQNANPQGNFTKGVLGMFKTYSTSYIEMTVTEEDLK